jgi:hypothetical protein
VAFSTRAGCTDETPVDVRLDGCLTPTQPRLPTRVAQRSGAAIQRRFQKSSRTSCIRRYLYQEQRVNASEEEADGKDTFSMADSNPREVLTFSNALAISHSRASTVDG